MSILSINRIKYLREELEAEQISTAELSEIESAYHELCNVSDELLDDPDNALADDMLNELERVVSPIEWAIYDFVCENYGESEANDPSWDIQSLAEHLEDQFEFKNVREEIRQGRIEL